MARIRRSKTDTRAFTDLPKENGRVKVKRQEDEAELSFVVGSF